MTRLPPPAQAAQMQGTYQAPSEATVEYPPPAAPEYEQEHEVRF
jgi:hypothetical protein